MDYSDITRRFFRDVDPEEAKAIALSAGELAKSAGKDVYERCLSCVDLTSLNATDSPESIKRFADKVSRFNMSFPNIAEVASICVYPSFVDVAGLALGDSEVAITSVAGGFPSSQTLIEVKMLECAMAEENGADEIDIVMNLGQFMDGNYDLVANEIEILRQELDEDTVLKVIIESGSLASLTEVRKAAVLAMAAGADFVKTSTGKNGPGATPEAVVVICEAIRDYHEQTGETIGVKVSGGVRTAADAAMYYSIVKSVLGEEWLKPELFRIGASLLANSLLSEIKGEEVNYF